jgi:hypothetical protein
MKSTPGFDSFTTFATAFEELDNDNWATCMLTAVSDDEGNSSDEEEDSDETRGETVEQARRHPDLPDSIFRSRAG